MRVELTRSIVPELPAPAGLPSPADIVPSRPRMPRVIPPESGTAEFAQELRTVIETLLVEYAAVSDAKGEGDTPAELRKRFFFELNSSGKYFTFKEKLKKSVVRVVKERFHAQGGGASPQGAELHKLTGEAYVFLVQEMHKCLQESFSPATAGLGTADMSAAQARPSSAKLAALAAEAEANEQYDEARGYLEDVVANDDASVVAWHQYSLFCLRMGDAPKAAQCLREAISLDPKHIPSLQVYAAMQVALGDLPTAQALLHGAVQLHGADALTWVLLGVVYQLLGADSDMRSCNMEAMRLTDHTGSPQRMAWRFLLDLRLTAVAAPLAG